MYSTVIFLIYGGFMICAVVVSRRRWATIGSIGTSWFTALALTIGYGLAIHNGAAAWERWGIATFIVPATIGSIHVQSTQATY
jgi:hypothetical protein